MLPQSSISSSSSAPPPSSACHYSTCNGEICPSWHRDISPGDRLFNKVAQDQDDLIIVVMGVTGAGKSTFINEFLGKKVMKVNHGLYSCTQEVESIKMTLPEDHEKWPNRRLVLVDTPGFDDTVRGEPEILRKISVWLASAYDNDTKITGLVYLHDIGNTRMRGGACLSYDVFYQICGPNALSRVVMATTQWCTVSANPERGQAREADLTTFWAETLKSGARYMRIQPPESNENDVIEYILTKQFAVATDVQEEMVDLDRRVGQTKAGLKLADTLQKRLALPATPDRPIAAGAAPHATMPSHGSANHKFDIVREDKFDAHPDDLIIVIMGATGSGKSTFINRFCGKELMAVNHGLRSCTKGIDVALFTLPSTYPACPNRRLVLVDTPGLDDTDIGEYEVLRRISVWLASAPYNMEVKIAGLVYLHSIGNIRMTGSSLLSHDLFRSMCGANALTTVVMASTQWDTLLHNPSVGPSREQDLKELWSNTLKQGAVYRRIDVADPERDTQDVIDYILERHAVASQIQNELVELNKRVADTEAAQKLKERSERWLGVPKAQDLSAEKEEKLQELPVDAGFLDRVKRLLRLMTHLDLTRVRRP